MPRGMARLAVVVSLCGAVLTGACAESDDLKARQTKQYAAIREALIENVRGQIGWSLERFRARESAMLFEVEESRGVQDLTYHWALHAIPQPHASVGVRAVVAARLREYRVVETPLDWWSVMGGWLPGSEGAAAEACLELIRLLRRDWPDRGINFLARLGTDPSEAGNVWAVADNSIHIDVPTPADPTWRTTAWFGGFRGPLAAARYRCSIPTTHDGDGGPELVVLDSVVRRSLFP